MKTFKFIFATICVFSLVLLSCSKDNDNEPNSNDNTSTVDNTEIIGTWQLKTLDGNATCTNGNSPYNVTKEVKDALPADMTSYNQKYTFNTNRTCMMDGDNGAFTYENKVLTTQVGSTKMVFTVLSADSQNLKLKMDESTSKTYAIEVADALIKDAGDLQNCQDYGITVTNASFTFVLTK